MERGGAIAEGARPYGGGCRRGKNLRHRWTSRGRCRAHRPARRLRSDNECVDLGVAAALYKGMILVLGGELPNHTFVENEAYDPTRGRWVALAPMPAGRHGFGGAAIGSNVY